MTRPGSIAISNTIEKKKTLQSGWFLPIVLKDGMPLADENGDLVLPDEEGLREYFSSQARVGFGNRPNMEGVKNLGGRSIQMFLESIPGFKFLWQIYQFLLELALMTQRSHWPQGGRIRCMLKSRPTFPTTRCFAIFGGSSMGRSERQPIVTLKT